MRFLLLVRHSEAAFAVLPDEMKYAVLGESVALTHELHRQGQYLHAARLSPDGARAQVSVRDGKASVTDGPFVETHEQIGGYFLVEAADRDEAIAIAARIPGARLGFVEVREVQAVPGLPDSPLGI